MTYNEASPQRLTIQNRNILHIDNALIEKVVTNNGPGGYILISYNVKDQNNQQHNNILRLNIARDTLIMNQFGEPLALSNLKKGMRIDADFSPAMTRSIPPQSRAFRIMIRAEEPSIKVTKDRVVSIDTENNFLYTGNPNDISDQIRFVITNATIILDQKGNRIRLNSIPPGQLIKIEHAVFQTTSIPPQTTAFRIKLL